MQTANNVLIQTYFRECAHECIPSVFRWQFAQWEIIKNGGFKHRTPTSINESRVSFHYIRKTYCKLWKLGAVWPLSNVLRKLAHGTPIKVKTNENSWHIFNWKNMKFCCMSSKIALWYHVKYLQHYCIPKKEMKHSLIDYTERSGNQPPKQVVAGLPRDSVQPITYPRRHSI